MTRSWSPNPLPIQGSRNVVRAMEDGQNRTEESVQHAAEERGAVADESSAASADLSKLAERQRRLINQFKV